MQNPEEERRMKGRKFTLVVSDLHLGAGDPLPDGTPNPLEDFREDAAFAELLRYYDRELQGQAGEWVANGDFFEMLFFSQNQGPGAHLRESDALARVRAIVAGHPLIFDSLAEFAAGRKRRVVFITGNHDPALLFRSVRRFLTRRIGGDIRFHRHYHLADDTYVEHGHRYEESFRIKLRQDLVHDGEPRIELPWGAQFLTDFVLPLRREHPALNKISPLLPFVRSIMRRRPFHFMRAALTFGLFVLKNRFSRNPRLRQKFARTLSILREDHFSSDLVPQARSLLARSPFRALVLGHTHIALDRELLPGQRYVNTGTWIPMAEWKNDRIEQRQRLTFALVHEHKAEPAAQLLEWTPGGPVPFEEAA
jgi:UDP-2,3-diacylglucosamine pyrophosphatase LpxH